MKTFEVRWAKCPTNYNPTCLLYVEAIDKAAAEVLARDHIKRQFGIGDWVSVNVFDYAPPSKELGRVLSGPPAGDSDA